MKHRIILVFIFALLSLFFWKVDTLKNSEFLGVCSKADGLCQSDWFYGVILPIYKSLMYLILSIALLIFFPLNFLKTWMKIMIPYSILALIAIISTPPLCRAMICFDRTVVASGLSKIFLILTILILSIKFVYGLIKSKKNKIKV